MSNDFMTIEAFTSMTPVRDVGRIVKKGSYRGFVWSYTVKRKAGYESSLEGDAIVVLDTDPSVTWLCEQPASFEIPIGGKLVSYTPDIAVLRNGCPTFIDVKPWRKANKPEKRLFYAAAKVFFARMRCAFIALTEREIRRQPRLRNVELIRRYGRGACNEGHVIRFMDLARGANQLTLGDFQKLSAANDNMPCPYTFINHGFARIDMSQPVNDNSVVELNKV